MARLLAASFQHSSARVLRVDGHKEHSEILRARKDQEKSRAAASPGQEKYDESGLNWVKDLWALDDGMWVLPATRGPVAVALTEGREAETLGGAREMFDIIIVDGPPVLGEDDGSQASVSQTLMPLAEARLFAILPWTARLNRWTRPTRWSWTRPGCSSAVPPNWFGNGDPRRWLVERPASGPGRPWRTPVSKCNFGPRAAGGDVAAGRRCCCPAAVMEMAPRSAVARRVEDRERVPVRRGCAPRSARLPPGVGGSSALQLDGYLGSLRWTSLNGDVRLLLTADDWNCWFGEIAVPLLGGAPGNRPCCSCPPRCLAARARGCRRSPTSRCWSRARCATLWGWAWRSACTGSTSSSLPGLSDAELVRQTTDARQQVADGDRHPAAGLLSPLGRFRAARLPGRRVRRLPGRLLGVRRRRPVRDLQGGRERDRQRAVLPAEARPRLHRCWWRASNRLGPLRRTVGRVLRGPSTLDPSRASLPRRP